jgi:peroxiredoxin
MKKFYLLLISCAIFSGSAIAQGGYDIKINFKGCTDTTVYLAKYFWDQLPITDSCKNFKNGKISFKGAVPLEKGVYFLANQARSSFYCQFIVDANQKFTINLDGSDVAGSLKSDDKQNEQFFSYIKYMTAKNKELNSYREQFRGKSKDDSIKAVSQKQLELNKQMTKFDSVFMAKNKGSFVYDLMNLKSEKYPTKVPLASNGRPDSVYQFYYYKNHYFDGVNFKDDRVIHTPFFADKVKKYFEHMVVQHPDSVIKELDKILMQCIPGSMMFNTLVGHYTQKFEQNKSMSFDMYGQSNTFEKVFIHLADKYIISGKTQGYYSAETIVKIKERVEVLRKLLPGSKVPNLFMIDTIYGRQVLKMGFDTAATSAGATYLYNKNADRLAPMYKTLYDLKAKYTILVFWAADCSHCQTEVPKLYDELQKIKSKVDYKVYAVQTKEELFDTWKKFIVDKKLTDFVHVFDPIHLNNLKEQFDIIATPVIYLLDREKRIIGKKLASDQVVEIMNKLEELAKEQNK